MSASGETTAATARRDSVWLHGPAVDLLFGYGLGYLASVPVFLLLAHVSGAATWPSAVAVLLALLVSGPHYGATILRVYEHRDDRRKYALFTVWVTLAIAALFVAGLRVEILGSLLITLYATWSPWHFAGQNYGLALMVLRRRGVEITPRAKRLIYASFLLSFALAFLELHGAGSRVAPGILNTAGYQGYRMLRLGIPLAIVPYVTLVVALVYVACTAGAAHLLLRSGRPRDLAPAASLVLTQALWFTVPAFVHTTSATSVTSLPFALIWISTAHAAQYLWVTSYYAKRENAEQRVAPYLVKALGAGTLVLVVPGLVFAPGLLGHVGWDAGLAAVVFSTVNVHHFILDGAIWKLRDGRVSRALLRPAETRPEPIGATRPVWARVAWAVGLALVAVPLLELWELEVRFSGAGADAQRAAAALDHLSWVGRDSARARVDLAELLASQGDLDAAEAAYRRSLELLPSATAWTGLGVVQERRGELESALASHRAALDVDPDDVRALFRSAVVSLRLADGGAPERVRSAIAALERVLDLEPGHVPAALRLARAHRDAGRAEQAIAVLEGALAATSGGRGAPLRRELAELRRRVGDDSGTG